MKVLRLYNYKFVLSLLMVFSLVMSFCSFNVYANEPTNDVLVEDTTTEGTTTEPIIEENATTENSLTGEITDTELTNEYLKYITGILIFFLVCFLFWACYKFFAMFF